MTNLPAILDKTATLSIPVSDREKQLLVQARKLFDGGFYDHALLDVWNASVNNLRRRTEAYGTDLWESVVKDEAGRKKFAKDGGTLSERWAGVDDLTLIGGCTKLGLLNKKAGKALEMINWMRNHASPAHESDQTVGQTDVIALAMLVQENLFAADMPDPGHSVSSLFDPIKLSALSKDQSDLLNDEINSLKNADLRVAFGFMLDLLSKGVQPAADNALKLLPGVWIRIGEDLRKTAGIRYHGLFVDPATDPSPDKGSAVRILDFLTEVDGIQYIPDGARAVIYRRAAKKLRRAKNTSYGWAEEEKAARTLEQFGPWVPKIAFEEVYQEILSVYCGNYWGRSEAHTILQPFIDSLEHRTFIPTHILLR